MNYYCYYYYYFIPSLSFKCYEIKYRIFSKYYFQKNLSRLRSEINQFIWNSRNLDGMNFYITHGLKKLSEDLCGISLSLMKKRTICAFD